MTKINKTLFCIIPLLVFTSTNIFAQIGKTGGSLPNDNNIQKEVVKHLSNDFESRTVKYDDYFNRETLYQLIDFKMEKSSITTKSINGLRGCRKWPFVFSKNVTVKYKNLYNQTIIYSGVFAIYKGEPTRSCQLNKGEYYYELINISSSKIKIFGNAIYENNESRIVVIYNEKGIRSKEKQVSLDDDRLPLFTTIVYYNEKDLPIKKENSMESKVYQVEYFSGVNGDEEPYKVEKYDDINIYKTQGLKDFQEIEDIKNAKETDAEDKAEMSFIQKKVSLTKKDSKTNFIFRKEEGTLKILRETRANFGNGVKPVFYAKRIGEWSIIESYKNGSTKKTKQTYNNLGVLLSYTYFHPNSTTIEFTATRNNENENMNFNGFTKEGKLEMSGIIKVTEVNKSNSKVPYKDESSTNNYFITKYFSFDFIDNVKYYFSNDKSNATLSFTKTKQNNMGNYELSNYSSKKYDNNGRMISKCSSTEKSTYKNKKLLEQGIVDIRSNHWQHNSEYHHVKKYFEVRNGNWKTYDANGQMILESEVIGGEVKRHLNQNQNGKQILKDGDGYYEVYENNILVMKSKYKNGRRNGITTWYYKNGQIEQSIIYKPHEYLNLLIGYRMEIKESFNKDGSKREKGTLKNGNGTIINYDESGNKTGVTTFKNGFVVN